MSVGANGSPLALRVLLITTVQEAKDRAASTGARLGRVLGGAIRDRKREDEPRPDANLAFDADPSTVGFHDPFRDEETQPAAFGALSPFPEPVENEGEVVGRDPGSPILDRE